MSRGRESLTCGRDNHLGLASLEPCYSSNRKLSTVEGTGAKHFLEIVSRKVCQLHVSQTWDPSQTVVGRKKKKNSRRIYTEIPGIAVKTARRWGIVRSLRKLENGYYTGAG